jgi:hypothetical protein
MCKIKYDWDAGTKQWFREDNGELAKDDIISESEKQEEAQL